jgi:quercetin dioxygenase-like cupin family protein
MTEPNDRTPGRVMVGGVSRRVTKGDVIIIPGHTAHWFSELETDIEYLIFRTDPDNRFELR